MKNLLVLAMSVFALYAQADVINMDVGQTVNLPSCGGTLKTSVVDNDLKLKFTHVKQCSNFSIISGGHVLNDYNKTKLDGDNQDRSGTFYISTNLFGAGWKSIVVQVNSNSGKHDEIIRVYYRVAPSLPTTAELKSCGGFVKVTQNAEQLNLVFKNVKECSNFDIIKASGETVDDYKSKKLQGENGNRSGSFTIPRKYIGYGYNTVRVIVKSNSGAHSDVVTVVFFY